MSAFEVTFDFACRDDCLDRMVPSDLRALVAERDRLRAELAKAKEAIAAEREDMAFDKMSLFAEIERLQASRSAEGDRLDWLLCKLPGNILRDLVGELSDTSDVAEWREAIDRAAGFPPPNAR